MGGATFAHRPAADLRAGRHPRADPADLPAHLPGHRARRRIWRRRDLCRRACADNKRGAATGWIQSSAVVRPARRRCWSSSAPAAGSARRHSSPGAGASRSCVSIVLLAISVWMRVKLAESPAFAKLKEEGEVSKAPLREAFAQRDNLKRVLIAFFGIMCAQGAVWYLTFFYMQVFLDQVARRARARPRTCCLIVMTVVSAPLYVFFGWLSDRVGRKPVMLGGMLLALVALFPRLPLASPTAANPALVAAQKATPVDRRDRPGDLLGPVRPGRHAPASTPPATSPRACSSRRGISYHDRGPRPTARPRVIVGAASRSTIARRRRASTAADLKALQGQDRPSDDQGGACRGRLSVDRRSARR